MAGFVAPKISVVVPVYNPGDHIDDCINSLLGQSLPASEYEVIFVDDGSTDGTGARLEAIATEHANVTTIHIENSGWPGRPRNVGIDAARGDYLLFVDNDDWLGREALERLHATALRTGADIVIPKVVGHRRGPPVDLFARNIDEAVLGRDPLLKLLTPHKLFRAGFVAEQGLRFPEGRVRLEDHLFVVPAYFAARTITVVADYAFYHWVRRDDRGNASERPLAQEYWDALARVLDIVESNTDPGAARDALLVHWYATKVLARVGGARFARRDADARRALVDQVAPLARERFGPGVIARLPSRLQARSRLLLAGDAEGLGALAEVEARVRGRAVVDSAAWDGGVLALRLRAWLVDVDGERVALPPADDLDVAPLRVFARSRADWDSAELPVDVTVARRDTDDGALLEWHAEVRLDPRAAAAGAPLSRNLWDLWAVLDAGGLRSVARVAAGDVPAPPPAVLGEDGVAVVPFATEKGNLSLDVDQHRDVLLDVVRPSRDDVRATVRDAALDVAVTLPGVHVPGELRGAGAVVLTVPGGGDGVERAATLVPAAGGARLEATFESLAPGRHRVRVRIGRRRRPLAAALKVGRRGVRVVDPGGSAAAGPVVRVKRAVRRLARG